MTQSWLETQYNMTHNQRTDLQADISTVNSQVEERMDFAEETLVEFLVRRWAACVLGNWAAYQLPHTRGFTTILPSRAILPHK